MPIPKEWNLSGKSIILTTGDRGWGPIIAAGLASAGANLVILGNRQKILDESEECALLYKNKVLTINTDLTNPEETNEAIEKSVSFLGTLDILVNDTQAEFSKPFLEITPLEYDLVMNRNMKSVFLCCQAALQHMVINNRGKIVNFASVLAERGVAHETAYSSSMAAIEQFTRSLAIELARTGITVNGIGTGWYTTENIPLEQQREDPLVRYLPSRRLGHPKEIIPLLILLCSDMSSYMNGQTIFVDGGSMTHA
tara:strand:+ start:118 stop:879 length:762 start_codon:yes stop_codon:yes gene_type:complete